MSNERPHPILICLKCAVRHGKMPVDKNARPYWRRQSCGCCGNVDDLIMTVAVGGLHDNWSAPHTPPPVAHLTWKRIFSSTEEYIGRESKGDMSESII